LIQEFLWQKHLLKLEQRKNPSFPPALCVVAGAVVVSMDIFALMTFAEYALENWQAKENFRA
jgi:hypothetical protein